MKSQLQVRDLHSPPIQANVFLIIGKICEDHLSDTDGPVLTINHIKVFHSDNF